MNKKIEEIKNLQEQPGISDKVAELERIIKEQGEVVGKSLEEREEMIDQNRVVVEGKDKKIAEQQALLD